MKLGIAPQKLGDLGMSPCHGVALQRMALILFQLVVEAAAAQNGAALFLAVFPVHLPQQKGAELARYDSEGFRLTLLRDE